MSQTAVISFDLVCSVSGIWSFKALVPPRRRSDLAQNAQSSAAPWLHRFSALEKQRAMSGRLEWLGFGHVYPAHSRLIDESSAKQKAQQTNLPPGSPLSGIQIDVLNSAENIRKLGSYGILPYLAPWQTLTSYHQVSTWYVLPYAGPRLHTSNLPLPLDPIHLPSWKAMLSRWWARHSQLNGTQMNSTSSACPATNNGGNDLEQSQISS